MLIDWLGDTQVSTRENALIYLFYSGTQSYDSEEKNNLAEENWNEQRGCESGTDCYLLNLIDLFGQTIRKGLVCFWQENQNNRDDLTPSRNIFMSIFINRANLNAVIAGIRRE